MPTSRISERSSGKMPTTSVRRPISLLKRFSGFVDLSFDRCAAGKRVEGENVLLGLLQQGGDLGQLDIEVGDGLGLAVRQDERDAPSGFEVSVRSDPREQQALGPSGLGRRPAADQERLGAAVLVLDPGAAAHAGQVWAAEPLGDDTLEAALPSRGQDLLRVGDEVARRTPAVAVIEPKLEQQLAAALVRELARGAAIKVEQIER
jgi:hypothetical protein